jgi:chromosome segregation and condensation protein ScpB
LSERVKTVSAALAAVKQPVTAADVAKAFARVKAEDVGEILETLCTMGHARRGKAEGTFLP